MRDTPRGIILRHLQHEYLMAPRSSLEYLRSINGTRGRPRLAYTPNWATGCWEWRGDKSHNGYGRKRYNDRNQPAHRAYYEELVGPIPDGLVIDHLCRNRLCVNPAHLEPVTRAENLRRGEGADRRKQVTIRTTASQREEACRGVMRGESMHSWGKRYGVATQNIVMWLRRRGYAYLPQPYKNSRRGIL